MSISYFKLRDRFDFSRDSLDIGNPVTWSRKHFLKHLFKKILTIHEDLLEEFYRHHLTYYLETHPQGEEKNFFEYLWQTVESQLNVLKSKDIYDKDHVRNLLNTDRLKKVMWMLMSLDRWDIHRKNQPIIEKQEIQIFALTQEITDLKAKLQEATNLDTKQYINVPKGRLLPLLDLFIQMADLEVEGKELVFSEFPIVWVKMICKYFREDHEEIDFNRVRRYFPKDKRNPSARSASIPSGQSLFTIKPVRKRS
ncbi:MULTISPECIES: hypothetical protein [Sphingobacterium]|uniref:hypothetical protein n=1 Tax=Sphingobacterium TaxID=28453 RepID=UPI00257C86C6|nr:MULTISPECIES: hypothetical protein [Sphingobacterium]